MSDYLVELFNMLFIFIICFAVLLYPMWEKRDVGKKFVYIYLICFAVILCAAHIAVRQFITMDLNAIRILRAYFVLPMLAAPIIVFHKRIWQAAVIASMGLVCYVVASGVSGYVAARILSDNTLLYAGIACIAITILTMPPVIFTMRRVSTSPYADLVIKFWRLAWIVPVMFLSIAITGQISYAAGNILDRQLISFMISAYLIPLSIIFLLNVLMNQNTSETEYEKQEIEFYREINHKIRAPLATVSADIQTAQQNPNKRDEMLTKAQSGVMEIAEIIRDTMEDGK